MQPLRATQVSLSGTTEADLVALAKRGSESAVRVIIQRYNQRLYRIARGVVSDDGEAEDVLQEAYFRAFSHLKNFRGESSLLTWLTRIVLNEALGKLRRRRPTASLDAVTASEIQEGATLIPFPNSCAGPDPEAALAHSQIRELLERAIDDLPEPFRLVFLLRDVEEMSIEETASQLDIRPETVKTRLHRARRLLRSALDQQLSSALRDAFPFGGTRCARLTDAVVARLAWSGQEPVPREPANTNGLCN